MSLLGAAHRRNAGSSITTIISEAFSGSGGLAGRTPDVVNNGNTWTEANGTWTVGSGYVNCAVTTSPWGLALIDAAVSDCTVSALMRRASSTSLVGGGLLFRAVDSANQWVARLRSSDFTLEILEITSGTSTSRATVTLPGWSNGEDVTIRVILNGTSITAECVRAGVTYSCNYTSSVRQTATLYGLYSRNSSYISRHDDFLITTP